MELSVGELARLAGVSVRTLHHYEAVGLLRPSGRTGSGHRRYGERDLERLHRILVYRQLGFDLGRIGEILADPGEDAAGHLRRQRALLEEQRARLDAMLKGVEAMLESKRTGVNLTPEEIVEVFGAFNPAEHAEEAEAQWGESAAYRESHRRTSKYGKQDWLAIKAEAQAIEEAFAGLMQRGEPATSGPAMAVAERHRQHIGRWFYACPPEVHRGLGEMYVADARFAQHYDEIAPGLARYVSAAVVANAARVAPQGG